MKTQFNCEIRTLKSYQIDFRIGVALSEIHVIGRHTMIRKQLNF